MTDQLEVTASVEGLQRELTDAIQREEATREVLELIARPGPDLDHVLRSVVANAVRICRAESGSLWRRDGGAYRMVASEGGRPEHREWQRSHPLVPDRGTPVGRALVERRTQHFPDLLSDPEFTGHESQRRSGARSSLAVPLMRGDEPVGVLQMGRNEVRPYTEAEIRSVETFATQAAIAIENARLFSETKAALEQQTATAQVLKTISRSAFDLQPVLGTLIENAARLCRADVAWMTSRLPGGEKLRAEYGLTEAEHDEVARLVRDMTDPPRRGVMNRLYTEGTTIHLPDVTAERETYEASHLIRAMRGRSVLAVPVRRNDTVLAGFVLLRREVLPFTEREIELVESFADQAAIAIENVRLFNETTESLEQQTAVSAILDVISRSPTDVQPVLEAVVANAVRLTGAENGSIARSTGDAWRVVAHAGRFVDRENYTRITSARPAGDPARARETLTGRVRLEKKTVQIPDMLADPDYDLSRRVDVEEIRSLLGVPLVSEGEPVGVIILRRKTPGPFSPRQVELVETFAAQAVIAIENVRLFNETKEALAQQTATSEVLQAISRSVFDLEAVLRTVLERARELCQADHAMVIRAEAGALRLVAYSGSSKELEEQIARQIAEGRPYRLGPGDEDALSQRRTVQLTDIELSEELERFPRGFTSRTGSRARLVVPLLRQDDVLGLVVLGRLDPKGFSPREVALVETFADQAVIAMENVRLFNETKEALEQQTASAEILHVIAASPTDVQPVLKAIAKSAADLCAAEDSAIGLLGGDMWSIWAHHGPVELLPDSTTPVDDQFVSGHAMLERRTIRVDDLQSDVGRRRYPGGARVSPTTRAIMATPLLRQGSAVGAIFVRRSEAVPFTDRHAALIEAFASQAVIAIENVRLFNETKEALDQQTATAQVLQVISRSAFDLQSVLDTLADNAVKLCEAEHCDVVHYDGRVYRDTAHSGVATEGYRELVERTEYVPSRATLIGRTLLERGPIQILDALADPEYEFSEAQKLGGFRTLLGVPIMREGFPIGAISVWRREVRPFTDRQMQLLQTFADQAAIAMENVRLFNETKESLERQTAVAGILRAISESPTDVQPVLDAIAESAARFCSAEDAAVILVDGDKLRTRAHHGPIVLRTQLAMEFPLTRGTVTGRAIVDRRTLQVPDLQAEPDDEYPIGKEQARRMGHRTTLASPLLREGVAMGAILLRRLEVRPFTEHQLDLVRTFADQAVIAIENVRLFNETKEALASQTAVADVLKTISRSAFDLGAVLSTLIERAAELCGADSGSILREVPDGYLISASTASYAPELREALLARGPRRPGRESVTGRVLLEGRTVQILDVLADPEYTTRPETDPVRTLLGVPMSRDGHVIGVLVLRRYEVRPFSEREMRIVETFADQAVIAIENVRLFNETKDALARQTAVAEVLGTISRSAFDLEAILTTVIQNAVRLCSAKGGLIFRRHGDDYRLEAVHGGHPGFVEYFKDRVLHPGRQAVTMRAVTVGEPVQIADVEADPEYEHTAVREFEPFRTVLGIPLLHQGKPIGAMSLWRNEVREFSPAEIELVKTFADQAAIAIENVRLFNETKEALEQQTATSEILSTMSRSAFDLSPVFESIVRSAAALCRADDANLWRADGDSFVLAAFAGEQVHPIGTRFEGSGRFLGRVAASSEPIHVPDTSADEGGSTDARSVWGTRLGVRIVKDGLVLGVISLGRKEPRGFVDAEIALVRTFADQAAIAIENVRLFNETKQSLERQTATSQVLEVISRSTFDLSPVLSTVVERARTLADADHVAIILAVPDGYEYAAYSGSSGRIQERVGQRTPEFQPRPWTLEVINETRTVHIDDVRLVDSAPAGPRFSAMAETQTRTLLGVPLEKDGRALGALLLHRERVELFSDDQIALVETFAKQAAIAIENARLFNEIQDKSRQLEVASRHKSEFLANMSHELRTPLNAIIGFTEVMLEEMFGPLNEKQKEYLDDVRSSGTHLLTLINDILDLSKIEAGRVELEITEFSFPDALENALTLVRERAVRHGITIAPEVAADVGTVAADERKVKQILVNLLSNAVKFTPDGGWVGVSVRRADGQVQVAVRDTGIGIAPEDQERIFEEFQQVGRDPDRSREGTGLGLTLAKRFVELHGGRIWVESEVGKGSTFTFAIPVRQTAMAEARS